MSWLILRGLALALLGLCITVEVLVAVDPGERGPMDMLIFGAATTTIVAFMAGGMFASLARDRDRHSEPQGDTAHNPADSAPISRKAE